MGFFEAFDRFVQGKPAFVPEEEDGTPPQDQGSSTAANPPRPTEGVIRKGDDKTFPVVKVVKTVPRFRGSEVHVYSWMQNTFAREVELHKLHIAGMTRSLHEHIGPRQTKEILIYKGPRFGPEKEKQHTEAWLDYRTQGDKDYFRAVFDVEYDRHGDGTYSIEDLHAKMPIRDIHE